MNSLTHIFPRAGVATFPAPQYNVPESLEKPTQRRGFDSNGAAYVYGKQTPGRFAHRLTWNRLPLTQKDTLISFITTAQGERYDVTWSDHQGLDHTVRIIGEFTWKQNTPTTCTASLGLEEPYYAILTDETGAAMLDEFGNVITW